MIKLVGLSGYAGSGKDEAAKGLDELGFRRVAFADVLRSMAYATDPYVEHPFGGFVRLSEIVDQYGWDFVKNNFPDARRLLQRLGTEGGRSILGENIWVDTLLNSLEHDKVVVTDVRFLNEMVAIKERGGITVRIVRPGVGPRNNHPSETSLDDVTFDRYLVNDGTIDELVSDMQDIVLATTKVA